jgi:hypothetical protein
MEESEGRTGVISADYALIMDNPSWMMVMTLVTPRQKRPTHIADLIDIVCTCIPLGCIYESIFERNRAHRSGQSDDD